MSDISPPPGSLTLYVVYDHPRDMPDYFVVRAQWPGTDGAIVRDPKAYGFVELENARRWLAQQGLTCLARHPDDDPVIIETWL